MTTLCDRDLRSLLLGQPGYPERALRIQPYNPDRIQPCSVDLTLSEHFLLPMTNVKRPRSIARSDGRFPEYRSIRTQRVTLEPRQFLLGSTLEEIEIGHAWRASVEGKSTLGRLGLLVHCTAGYIDPGFRGQITLELLNVAPYAIELVAGEPICQLSVEMLSGIPERPYGSPSLGSHYQHQQGATAPKL